ncbi:MAG: metal ABC transporter permease [OCS116 cluster bacterium]|nr:metal ABC transporter permease [OCS116 cluster bacterium]
MFEFLDDFFIRALIAGIAVALIAGPFGCLLAWRRMAFMGETIAHSSLLGVVLGLMLGIVPQYAILFVAVIMAVVLYFLDKAKGLARDVSLSVIAHGALGVGLFLISLMPEVQVDLEAYLFGSLFAIDEVDLAIIFIGGSAIFATLLYYWRSLVAVTISPDLAHAENVVRPEAEFVFTLMVAVLVAITMKITGLLLVSAILIIPAAAARFISKSPEQMAVLASIIGMTSVAAGLYISLLNDVAGNAAIIVVAISLFASCYIASKLLFTNR